MSLRVYVRGVGVLGPGMPDWSSAQAVLRGEVPYDPSVMPKPDAAILPPAERRRASPAIRTSLSVASQAIRNAGVQASDVATIFATSDCDAENMNHVCDALATAQLELSPTRFHNSVQNAPAGYWTIATSCTQASSTVNSYDEVIAHGMLEAAVMAVSEARTVMLVAHDLPMPPPLYALRPIQHGFAVAFVLAPAGEASDTALDVDFSVRNDRAPTRSTQPELEALRESVPSAHALPLLERLAQRRSGEVHLDYGGGRWLDITVHPEGQR